MREVRDGAPAWSRDPEMREMQDGAPAWSRDPEMREMQDGDEGGSGWSSRTDPGRRGPRLIPGMLPQRSGVPGRRAQVCVARVPLPRQTAGPGLVWFACPHLSGSGRCSRRCCTLRGGILPSTNFCLVGICQTPFTITGCSDSASHLCVLDSRKEEIIHLPVTTTATPPELFLGLTLPLKKGN
ncbi:hypothetical protein Nmel_007801, partial [Mimus melanotis]